MTDKTPKLLVDALGAIDLAHEFVYFTVTADLDALHAALSQLLAVRG